MNIRHRYGIDLGTGTVKIYDQNKKSITKERNMIALQDQDTVFAVGNQAFELFERNPEDLQIITPMQRGRIRDVLMMEAVLHTLLHRTGHVLEAMPVLYLSVPLDMTELERRAYGTIARKGRFRRSRLYFVEKPVADALAIGLPIHRTRGTMMINIGAQSTEVSVISEGKTLISRVIEEGGEQISAAVANGVRNRNRLQISLRAAQRLKWSLPDLNETPPDGYKITGIDVDSGLPREDIVSARTVAGSMRDVLAGITDEVARLLDRLPPQMQSGVYEDGIFVTGGTTHVSGLQSFLQERLAFPVTISEHHEYSTVEGLKQIIEHPELRHWATVPKQRKTSYER